MTSVQGATRGTLAGLALPNCESYHRWHSTRLKGKVCVYRKGKIKRKKRPRGKTTLRNIAVKSNVDIVFKYKKNQRSWCNLTTWHRSSNGPREINCDPLDLTATIADNDGTNPTTEQDSWTREISLSAYPSYLPIFLLSSNNKRAGPGERVIVN